MSLKDRARHVARQGHSFLTANPVRVVYQPKDGEEPADDAELVDVPKDGKTTGEIVMRGNLAMMEVRTCAADADAHGTHDCFGLVFPRPRGDEEGLPGRVFPQRRCRRCAP